ncbi:hypothetical protein IAR50_002606 [Cryptococcus sp. DSM 104548]
MEVVIDDSSPQLVFKSASNGWMTDHSQGTTWYDSLTDMYLLSTFHSTYTEDDSLVIRFNGTTVELYGAKRENHGVFGVNIDGVEEQLISGWAASSLFQQKLFQATGLANGTEHTMTVTNYPSKTTGQTNDGTGFWLDIDYIIYSSEVQATTTIIDDTSAQISYDDAWAPVTDDVQRMYNQTEHGSSTKNSAFTLSFNGSSAQVYAAVGPDNGQYSVSLDGGSDETFSASWPQAISNVPMYTISGLPDTLHTLKFENLEPKPFSLDYAVINSTSSSASSSTDLPSSSSMQESSTGGASRAGAIAGGIVGGALGLGLVFALAWFLFWRRKGRHTALEFESGPDDRRSSFYYSRPIPQRRSHSHKSTSTSASRSTASTMKRDVLAHLDLAEKSDDEEDEDWSSSDSSSRGHGSWGLGRARGKRHDWSPDSSHAPLSAPLATPRSGGLEAQMSNPAPASYLPSAPTPATATAATERPFLTLIPPPPTSNATSYIPSAGPSRGLNTLGRIAPFAPRAASSTAPSVYSQDGTFVSTSPEPIHPRYVRERQGEGEGEGDLLEDKFLSWGYRASSGGALDKLQREWAYTHSTTLTLAPSQSKPPSGDIHSLHPPPSTPRTSKTLQSRIRPISTAESRTQPQRRPSGPRPKSSRASMVTSEGSRFTNCLHVTSSSPSSRFGSISGVGASPVSPPLALMAAGNMSSSELAYKAELVALPYTATAPPLASRSDDRERQDDLWERERIQVPGREIDMGPLPLSSGGTLPPGYLEALRADVAGRQR